MRQIKTPKRNYFSGVNGTQLTVSNYQSLLSLDGYTLNLADYDGAITPNENLSRSPKQFSENPILINKVITSGSHKIGYLMYNGFTLNMMLY
jgi:hypothetical protein